MKFNTTLLQLSLDSSWKRKIHENPLQKSFGRGYVLIPKEVNFIP